MNGSQAPATASLAGTSSNELISARHMQVAATLALYLAEKGGSMLACQLHQYYDGNPGHKGVINKVPAFCEEHPGLLMYTPDRGGGKMSLPRHCCLFLQKSCTGKHGHQGLLHVDLPPGAVHCQCGKQCPVGHWKQIEAQANGSLGKGKGKSRYVPKLPATAGNDSCEESVLVANGKGVGNTEPSSLSAAATMAMFIHGRGSVVAGAEISDYYNRFPRHKEVIKSIGFKEFCTSYDGLFILEPGPSGQIRLASYCCWYLRDCCTKKQSHGCKCLHLKPNSQLAMCNFGPKCTMGHWKQVLDLSAGIRIKPTDNVARMPRAQAEDQEIPVSQIRWCHNGLRVIFRDGRLVVMMLKELLDGSLLVGQIPKFEVYEDEGVLYAWTGNRRLWVLKEFEVMTGRKITVRVKKKAGKLPKQSPKYTTTTRGESVTFFASNFETEAFPSMGFALAALRLSTAPSTWDVELGRLIRASNYACPISKAEQVASSLPGVMPGSDLKEYLLQKKHLFSLSGGMVDNMVKLTTPIDALRHLEGDLPAAAAVLDPMGEDGNRK